MITPVAMCKISIAGSKDILDDAIEILHGLKLVHIDDYTPDKLKELPKGYFDIGTPFERAGEFSEILVRARVLLEYFKIKPRENVKPITKFDDSVKTRVEHIENKVNVLQSELKDIETKLNEINSLKKPLDFYYNFNIEPSLLQPTEELVVFRGVVGEDPEPLIKEITGKYEIFLRDYNKEKAIILFVLKKYKEAIKKRLGAFNYRDIALPPQLSDLRTIKDMVEKRTHLENRKDEIKKEIAIVGEGAAEFLLGAERFLTKETEKAEAPLRFAVSENGFVVDGWIPTKKFKDLKTSMKKKFGENVYVERSEEEYDFAPTELKNPSVVDSFEFFLNLYSMPIYKELDPTFLIFFTFPLFFGFMLGDMGYGLVTGILFFVLSKKFTGPLKGLMNALTLASVATIGFGAVFGEFFGETVIPPLIHREHDINTMLMISIIVGLIHINLGFVLGIINIKKKKGWKEAILKNGSWMVLELGAAVFALGGVGILQFPYITYIGGVLLIISLGMLYGGHGALGLVELPSILSNILSYARLFAIGLASVSLALIVNEFAKDFFLKGWMYAPFAIMILVAGHMLNIAIGIIGCFLQSLRLHYVEFFTKFYKGGGERYAPFGKKMPKSL